jgi:hypothetical protein
VPLSNTIPKTKEEFSQKIKYINNLNDMIDVFISCEDIMTGKEMSLYLEKFHQYNIYFNTLYL